MIRIRQLQAEPWCEYPPEKEHLLWNQIGFFEPILVMTQEEKDYLLGVQFLIGKTFTVLLNAVDWNQTKTPPTYMEIDL